MKLNQILAIEKSHKAHAEERLTALHQQVQKSDLLSGLARTYQARNEEEQELPPPPEHKAVQLKAEETLGAIATALTPYWDTVATKDATNGEARADLVVDGKVLIKDLPAVVFLFLETQLVNLHTYVSKLPVLDPGEEWHYDGATNLHVSAEKRTLRTRKLPRAFVKAEATDKHPAQVDSYMEDIPIGTWTLRLFSGALAETRRRGLIERVETLQRAVKAGREAANAREAVPLAIGRPLFDFLFAKE